MKKYYIPTSTLNFNNILSTESISPKLFYEKRGFGYYRWTSVDENNVDYVTLLFDVPHEFNIPESNEENHPMLIEIETDEIFSSLSNGVCFTNKTIYLNPWQTKFHFFSEDVKNITKSMSNGSLETKLVRLYERGMYVSNFEGAYPNVDLNALEMPSQKNIDEYIEEDYRINKMKGLLYGYYIGANISSKKEVIKELASLREIYNIFSSVISDQDRKPSKEQSNRLNELLDFWQSQDPLYQDLKRVIEIENVIPREKLNALLSKIWNVLLQQECIKRIDMYSLTSNPDYAISWVSQEIEKLNDKIEKNRTLLRPDDDAIIISSTDKTLSDVSIQDNQMNKLFCFLINNVLCSRAFNGKISSVKEGLSDEITKAAKDVIGQLEWENSSVREYLNQLRRHLRGQEFNQSWDNGVLSSIAAVLIKGDDWEQLLYFMQSRKMYDYRLAYAIYGVLNGFANMTRDFTDILLKKEYGYLSTVYFSIHEQLHGKNLGNLIKNRVQSKFNDNSSIIEQWGKKAKEALTKYSSKKDIDKYAESLSCAFSENGDNTDVHRFLEILSRHVKKSTKLYKELGKKLVKGSCEDRGKIKQRNDNLSLELSFGDSHDKKVPHHNSLHYYGSTCSIQQNKNDNSILNDTRWIEECVKQFVEGSEAQRQFRIDMEWFVQNHSERYYDQKKKQYIKGYYYGKDSSNRAVLDRLEQKFRNDLDPNKDTTNNKKWLRQIYEKIPLKRVFEYLENSYGK